MLSKLKIKNIENDIRKNIRINVDKILTGIIRQSNFEIVDKNINSSIWFKIFYDVRNKVDRSTQIIIRLKIRSFI